MQKIPLNGMVAQRILLTVQYQTDIPSFLTSQYSQSVVLVFTKYHFQQVSSHKGYSVQQLSPLRVRVFIYILNLCIENLSAMPPLLPLG